MDSGANASSVAPSNVTISLTLDVCLLGKTMMTLFVKQMRKRQHQDLERFKALVESEW